MDGQTCVPQEEYQFPHKLHAIIFELPAHLLKLGLSTVLKLLCSDLQLKLHVPSSSNCRKCATANIMWSQLLPPWTLSLGCTVYHPINLFDVNFAQSHPLPSPPTLSAMASTEVWCKLQRFLSVSFPPCRINDRSTIVYLETKDIFYRVLPRIF